MPFDPEIEPPKPLMQESTRKYSVEGHRSVVSVVQICPRKSPVSSEGFGLTLDQPVQMQKVPEAFSCTENTQGGPAYVRLHTGL